MIDVRGLIKVKNSWISVFRSKPYPPQHQDSNIRWKAGVDTEKLGDSWGRVIVVTGAPNRIWDHFRAQSIISLNEGPDMFPWLFWRPGYGRAGGWLGGVGFPVMPKHFRSASALIKKKKNKTTNASNLHNKWNKVDRRSEPYENCCTKRTPPVNIAFGAKLLVMRPFHTTLRAILACLALLASCAGGFRHNRVPEKDQRGRDPPQTVKPPRTFPDLQSRGPTVKRRTLIRSLSANHVRCLLCFVPGFFF